ncbi:hypothetical protein CLOM_g11222 [Closterium sp. NIES-68]|nr:hypothetical protein CLOM_g11222 [Closterium sp. NIES-68]GJP76304.1 hypothetical protein CLOP_g6769 [Closterium sp. NIES-67]
MAPRVHRTRTALLVLLAACVARAACAWYVPPPGTSFVWHLSGADSDVDPRHPAKVYTVDASLAASTMARLRRAGKRVMCYISFGTAEDWRGDYHQFPNAALGGLVCRGDECADVWPGERWVDVKSAAVRAIMEARVQAAKSKGCDGVDPDNINAYSNNITVQAVTDFTVTEDDQYAMSVGLKNPGSLAPSHMAGLFDWALIESCSYYSDWGGGEWYSGKYQCDYANEFIVRSKAVFAIEYAEQWGTSATTVNGMRFPQGLCADSNAHGFTTNLCTFDLGLGPRYRFANCPLHKPAGCDGVWRQCVKEQVYRKYQQRHMERWDAVGQCMRARRAACKYKA